MCHPKSKYFCGTCHDVSNPVLANLGLSGLPDQSGGLDLITEQYAASQYFHVERTFSEFMLSAYGQPGGAPTNLEFQAQGAPDLPVAMFIPHPGFNFVLWNADWYQRRMGARRFCFPQR